MNAVRFEIPDGYCAVKPMPKPGWRVSTEIGAYDVPHDDHGIARTEGVRAAIWSGGDLPDAFYEEFMLRDAVGGQLTTGQALHLPAVQTCANGIADRTDGSGEGGKGGVPNPAPSLVLVEGSDDHGRAHGAETAEVVTFGTPEITAPFARATVPNQPVAGGYMTIANTGGDDDTLVAVSSPAAGRMEVQEMAMEGDVMRTRALEIKNVSG